MIWGAKDLEPFVVSQATFKVIVFDEGNYCFTCLLIEEQRDVSFNNQSTPRARFKIIWLSDIYLLAC